MEADKRFNKILVGAFLVAIFIAAVLAVLVDNTAPHVTGIAINRSKLDQEVSVQKPSIDIYFSHPMDRKSVEDAVKVIPESVYTLNWGMNNLQINFTENLDLDTNYQVSISKDAKDTYGKQPTTDFKYSFQTESPKFTYLERNGLQQQPDKVLTYDLKSASSKELYSELGIEYFARNDNYLVVSTLSAAKVSVLKLKNLAQNTVSEINIGVGQFRVTRLAFSPRYDQFAFVAQEVIERNGVAIPQASSYIYLYDIPSRQIKKFIPPNILDVMFSPDGGSLLFRGDEAIYYLIDIQTDELIELERHFASGGFSREVNRIVFVDYDPVSGRLYPNINIYNTNREVTSVTNGEQFVVDPEFFHRTEQVIFSEKSQDLDGTKGIFSVIISDLEQKRSKVITKEGLSLELPKLSQDDRYVLVENYTPEELKNYQNMRNYVFQTKPYSGGLSVYDLNADKFLDIDLRGVDAVWD